MTIDGEVIDLSAENVDRNTGVQDGCRPLQDYCRGGMSKCPRGRKCHSKWNGHICHCAHSTHDDKKECATGRSDFLSSWITPNNHVVETRPLQFAS